MMLESIASALNLRAAPGGAVIGEMRTGDLAEWNGSEKEWVDVSVKTGYSAGKSCVARRKWLIQHYEEAPQIASINRNTAAEIIRRRSVEFDSIHYALGTKARNWDELRVRGSVDCSGWVYLLSQEIMDAYSCKTSPGLLYTYSDEQITNVGKGTKAIISGRYLTKEYFIPGALIGIDFSEYSWDKGRPLDIDHIAIVGATDEGLMISQSSSNGGGVNTVTLEKWLNSQMHLIISGRVHLVDLLSLP